MTVLLGKAEHPVLEKTWQDQSFYTLKEICSIFKDLSISCQQQTYVMNAKV